MPKNKQEQSAWCELAKNHLMNDKANVIIDNLTQMISADSSATKNAKNLKNYLTSNQDRIQYKTFQDRGFTIGSGGMESINKSVMFV